MSLSEKSYWRARRESLTANGICIDCAKDPHTPTSRRCDRCSKKIAAYQRRYIATRRARGEIQYKRTGYADGDGMSFREIGKRMGISRSRAEQIYQRAISKFWRECVRLGIDAGAIVGRNFSMLATAERWADE